MKPYTELKFVFPNSKFTEISQFFGQHLIRRPAETLRNIYFDSPGLKYFRQRSLNSPQQFLFVQTSDEKKPRSDAFLVLKRFSDAGNMTFKAPVLYGNINSLLETGNVVAFAKNDDRYPSRKTDSNRFLFHHEQDNLKPKVEVVYDRHLFSAEMDAVLEICLDRAVSGCIAHRDIQCNPDKKLLPMLESKFIVTIKWGGELPEWLSVFVNQQENRERLMPADFSKYQMAIRDFWLPSPVRKLYKPKRTALALVQAVLPAGLTFFLN